MLILVRALRALGADVGWYLPSRSEDGYVCLRGPSRACPNPAPACWSRSIAVLTAVEQVRAAHAAGLDVVITDHHSPRADGELPDCPIVHPALCRYPTSQLCGTAVAHKLAEALGAATAADDLELVALATVADLMPLRGENRRIVREGLVQMVGAT